MSAGLQAERLQTSRSIPGRSKDSFPFSEASTFVSGLTQPHVQWVTEHIPSARIATTHLQMVQRLRMSSICKHGVQRVNVTLTRNSI